MQHQTETSQHHNTARRTLCHEKISSAFSIIISFKLIRRFVELSPAVFQLNTFCVLLFELFFLCWVFSAIRPKKNIKKKVSTEPAYSSFDFWVFFMISFWESPKKQEVLDDVRDTRKKIIENKKLQRFLWWLEEKYIQISRAANNKKKSARIRARDLLHLNEVISNVVAKTVLVRMKVEKRKSLLTWIAQKKK